MEVDLLSTRDTIIEYLKNNVMTIVDLANLTGFSKQRVQQYLTGINDSVEVELKCLEVLNL